MYMILIWGLRILNKNKGVFHLLKNKKVLEKRKKLRELGDEKQAIFGQNSCREESRIQAQDIDRMMISLREEIRRELLKTEETVYLEAKILYCHPAEGDDVPKEVDVIVTEEGDTKSFSTETFVISKDSSWARAIKKTSVGIVSDISSKNGTVTSIRVLEKIVFKEF